MLNTEIKAYLSKKATTTEIWNTTETLQHYRFINFTKVLAEMF